MKNIIIASLAICMISCANIKKKSIGQPSKDGHQINGTGFFVHKIDSVQNVYVIYASKDKVTYKILSVKNNVTQGAQIKVGYAYQFMLRTIFTQELELVRAIMYHGTVINNEGDSMASLHEALNVRGLKVIGGGSPSGISMPIQKKKN